MENATDSVEWTPIDAFGGDTGYPNVLHIMTAERPEQRRGVPFVAAQIEQIKQLDRYLSSELAANVVSAMLTAFVVTDDDDTTGLEDAVNEEDKITDDDHAAGTRAGRDLFPAQGQEDSGDQPAAQQQRVCQFR